MPRRVWRSLDGPYVAPAPGDTVDLRGTTKDLAVEERKEILLQSYYSGVGSYFGGYSAVTTVPGRPWTIERGVKEAYGRVPWVHAAVRVIAISQSRLRFGVKDNDKPVGEGASEVTGDQLIPLLNVRSNPVEYAYQLRQRVSTQWMLSPRGGFIEAVPPERATNSKRILEFRLLPAGRTRVVPDKGGNIDHFAVDPVGGIGKPREIPPERVRWFREPHPTDPYAGLTPLEAAGLSVEMDYFARLFNRSFMANDGRPGGIVGVTSPDGKGEPADDKELDRVERKFGGGPVDAGRLVVLDGTVTYEDVTKSARDMQWKDAGIAARNEIFGVFLVPVSAIDASGRTFSNAGQEWINFWTLMGQPHGDAFAWLFHDDVSGVPFLDYSKVAALEELKQTQRAEWRDEVEQGLRTRLRYAMDTGQKIGNEPGDFPDVPATRSLWLPAGLVPVALNDEDQVAVEKLAPIGSATQAAPLSNGAAGGDQGGDQGGGDMGGDGGGDGGLGPDQGGYPTGGGEAKRARDTNLTRLATRRQKRDRALHAVGGGRPTHDDEDKEDERARPVEAALAAALTALAQRQVGVALARVRGTKARMGTRHWAPKPGEPWSTKELDPNDVVDPQTWSDQAAAVAQQNLAPLAQQQHDETRQQVEADGSADAAAIAALLGPPVAGAAALLLAGEVAQLATWVATGAAHAGAELLEVIAEAERADSLRVAGGGQPAGIQPIVDAIQKWAQGIPDWVARIVPTSVAQAVEAGKHAVLAPLGDRVEREWRTKRDDRVRAAHKDAEGQVAAGGAPFTVGGEQLRYPRDPLGSPGNVINCRCRTRWRLAAATQTKYLAVGQNVIADVLAFPTPSTVYAVPAKRDHRGECDVPSLAGGLRGARVSADGALAGVADRDHVAEMLGGPETKVRRVRTAGGSRRYKEPIGSPIVAHPGLHGLGDGDHASSVASDAARVASARRELADRMTAIRGGMPMQQLGPSPAFPGHDDHPAADLPDASAGATGDMAKAKAELAGKGQDVAGLMAKGMTAEEAAKEYARLLHNARFRYRRDRLKAEKAAGGKVAETVAEDVAQGPKEETLGGIGEQLLTNPDAVKLDKALAAESGVQPKALYTVKVDANAASSGPGGVLPHERWYDKLTADTDEPVPVSGLQVADGYVVQHGFAVRKDGIAYLIETPTPTVGATGAGQDAVHAEALAKVKQAQAAYTAMLAGVPADKRGLQRGVALLRGRNPKDGAWAKTYKQPGFTSAATASRGGTQFWNGNAVHPGVAAHEYGHNLDSQVYLPHEWLSDGGPGPSIEGQELDWGAASARDDLTQRGFKLSGFKETRADGQAHPITIGGKSVTEYGANHRREDFAESVRLYLKDRREGKLGYLPPKAGQALGTNVRFADLWPERARVLDAAFGTQTDFDTPYAKERGDQARAELTGFLHTQYEASQTAGNDVSSPSVQDVMAKFGLSQPAAVRAYGDAQQQFAKDLASKNEQDALEHVKEELSGQANAPDEAQLHDLRTTLVDMFGLGNITAGKITAAGADWHAQQLAAKQQAEAATAAKLEAEKAVQDVLSLEDLPKEVQTVIRKRRANVKLRAKQKGATPEQAEAIAAAYEAEQIAKEAKKLGLAGQVLGKEIVKGKVAEEVHGQAKGPELRVKPGVKGASKGSATWLAGAGTTKHSLSKGAYYGKPQQAKSNIAAELASRLNNEQDWETFRAAANSGASRGYNLQFEYPKNPVKAYGDYTDEERQALLDAEVSQRIQMWASTSGDSNPFAVMMQQAIKDELGVPGPVGVNDANGNTQAEVDKRYPHMAAFYRRFVRVQYEHTQESLAADGIEWIALYRGMGVERGAHAWANESDDGYVPLQPGSSFSTAPNVSARFAGNGVKRMMIRAVVHRSQLLGSARTGFGCLNEKEYVVLAPRDETEGRFQVRYFAGSKVADVKAAFDRPVRKPPTMTATEAQDALKAALGNHPLSPSKMLTYVRTAPAGSVTFAYPIGAPGGETVQLPYDAAVAYLENYGYTV